MAIQLPNGKISRTLPEQVGFNSEKIYEIIKFLNESGLKDLVISVDAASGTLTPEQLAIAELSPSYVLYGGKVYVKALEDLTNIDFIQVGVSVSGSTEYQASIERVRVVKDTRAYAAATVNLFESYTSDQIDILLAAKADLSGANFTGPITAPSIIENMTGYTFQARQQSGDGSFEWSPIYAGICKNGNKLTIVIFGSFIYTSASGTYANIANIQVPQEIANKIFPFTLGTLDNIVSNKKIDLLDDSALSTFVNVPTLIQKYSNLFVVQIRGLSNCSVGRTYLFRIEETFLLSDNLAQ